MAFSLPVPMVFSEDCSHDFFLILQIIRKSTYQPYLQYTGTKFKHVYRVLIACIKFLGEYLCPRCKIPLQDVDLLGLKRDAENRKKLRRLLTEQHTDKVENARKAIFEQGYGVESEAVKRMLDSESLTAIRVSVNSSRCHRYLYTFQNAFASLGVDIFKLISPEKLHEWDVGKVKDLIVQLVRILHSLKGDAISAFDRRLE